MQKSASYGALVNTICMGRIFYIQLKLLHIDVQGEVNTHYKMNFTCYWLLAPTAKWEIMKKEDGQ